MLNKTKFRYVLPALFFVAVFCVAGAAQAGQVVVVEPVIGNFVASGDALRSAVEGIVDASSAKRYLVKVEPGTYDLGHKPLFLQEWIDLEGSGSISTRILGYGSDNREQGVVNGSVRSEVRHLRIIARTGDNVIAFYANTGALLTDVEAIAKDGTQCWAVRFGSGTGWPTVRDSKLTAMNCTGYNSGVTSKSGIHATIVDTQIRVYGATNELYNIGLYFDGGGMPSRLDDLFIQTGDATTPGVGVKVANDYASSNWLRLSNSQISTYNGIGVFTETALTAIIRHSSILSSRVGVQYDGMTSTGILQIHESIITGTTNTLAATDYSPITWMRVGASQLAGGPISAPGVPVKCAGVYDENFNFFPNTCP